MQRITVSLLVALLCTLIVLPSFAKDFYQSWYLPWFSKDQHLYICGPAEAYGLTKQQVDELEADLDRLSSFCDINLYFSIVCTSEMDTNTQDGYTGLLVERWTRNQLPKKNRAVLSLVMNPVSNSAGFTCSRNFDLSAVPEFDQQLRNAEYRYLASKPFLYPFINYITLATENSARSHMSPEQLSQGELIFQKHLADKQSRLESESKARAAAALAVLNAELERKAKADAEAAKAAEIAKARASDKPKEKAIEHNSGFDNLKALLSSIVFTVAVISLIIFFSTRRPKWKL